MNQKEKLALFLGMLSGDGCLSIKHNGKRYRIYPIQFCNTDTKIVQLFARLFFELFGITGRISSRKWAENSKEIWEFLKHSKKIVGKLREIGFPEGVKKEVLRIPSIIKKGSYQEKKFFMSELKTTHFSVW